MTVGGDGCSGEGWTAPHPAGPYDQAGGADGARHRAAAGPLVPLSGDIANRSGYAAGEAGTEVPDQEQPAVRQVMEPPVVTGNGRSGKIVLPSVV
ncbi:hypothetical protein GCM10009530_12320 [Microbispora corallina]|uniref:Uncharacterized protein n=1 Tax=Microbispora corallina TaxID=83302 RepID=A0ABQ4FTC2_9ACTN|nr:hypothetical protein Mco01_10710 [Microbispora corallina]